MLSRTVVAACLAMVALCGAAATVGASNNPMTLQLLADSIALSTGARCLDGTSPGLYFRPGYGDGADNWVIFFQGGGWCYTREDCLARSKTALGSNKFWGKEYAPQGVLNADQEANPDFYNWNSVKLLYCDGDSFCTSHAWGPDPSSGDATMPDVVDGTEIYYRGHRILKALLDMLARDFKLDMAKQVLVSGCSAGGLSTYLHADYVADYMKTASGAPTKAMAGSGFFMDLPNTAGVPVYETEMRNVFTFQNATNGVNAECIAAYPANEQWKCNMAQYTYPHIKTPFFIMNSYYDEWQMGNILFIDIKAPGTVDCEFFGYKNCSTTQLDAVVPYGHNLVAAAKAAPQFTKPGNGAFLHSCWNHCAASSDVNWVGTEIDGVSMRDAVGDWYFERSGSGVYDHIGCVVNPATRGKCNPTCNPGYRPYPFDL